MAQVKTAQDPAFLTYPAKCARAGETRGGGFFPTPICAGLLTIINKIHSKSLTFFPKFKIIIVEIVEASG